MKYAPKHLSTGCQACRMSCKHSAIQMVENEKGNIYPIINEEKCTGCQRCINTCPALHPISTNSQKQPRVFCRLDQKRKTNVKEVPQEDYLS